MYTKFRSFARRMCYKVHPHSGATLLNLNALLLIWLRPKTAIGDWKSCRTRPGRSSSGQITALPWQSLTCNSINRWRKGGVDTQSLLTVQSRYRLNRLRKAGLDRANNWVNNWSMLGQNKITPFVYLDTDEHLIGWVKLQLVCCGFLHDCLLSCWHIAVNTMPPLPSPCDRGGVQNTLISHDSRQSDCCAACCTISSRSLKQLVSSCAETEPRHQANRRICESASCKWPEHQAGSEELLFLLKSIVTDCTLFAPVLL